MERTLRLRFVTVVTVTVLFWTLVDSQRVQDFSEGVDSNSVLANSHFTNCFDDRGNPRKCVPDFENAAYGRGVLATSTCGQRGQAEYCIQTGSLGLKRACEICDHRIARLNHDAKALTDLTTSDNETWWQSETLFEGIQQVNLTLKLKKAFEITYIRLKFHSPRPESFAIYKRVKEDGPWLPYQFYSAACRDFYNLPNQGFITGGDETRPLCIADFSDISPLTGGDVAFPTLQNRPTAYKENGFENSKELQEWVTATDIRITLDRLNTFGDEVFGDEKVLRSYFFAVTDLSVGGVCKCNGHASKCENQTDETGEDRLTCVCEHNTEGRDCEECKPLYRDQPWGRATSTNANECKACNCNGFSNNCFFNQSLYELTGHGGHCEDCTGNRDGANCEKCRSNFYQRYDGYCISCDCDPTGSRHQQCNTEGKCQCQPGVIGEKCDRCQANYYEFSKAGCKDCGCSLAGSRGNQPRCTLDTGDCSCKENVEGKRCTSCKPNYFNLDVANEFGCTPCFCYGHSAVCRSSPGYAQVILESDFAQGSELWKAEESLGRAVPLQYNTFTQSISAIATGRDSVYFLAPERFLGDHRGSYNQELNFTLRIGEHGPKPSADDIILEGSGLRISQPIFGNRNALPSSQEQEFSFRLHEKQEFGWNPRISPRDFMSLLSKLSAIKIRATYTPRGTGFLDKVKVKTVRRGASGPPAPWIETCQCPEGYVGQYCESCAPGYKHEPSNGGPFARCVPCFCNGHARMCDPESGQCICEERTKTAGDNCEKCARGYFGSPQKSMKLDENDVATVETTPDPIPCEECPCPRIGGEIGACIQLADKTVVCLECPFGYAGPTCQFCGDGFFGNPTGAGGVDRTDCAPCECNKNIDTNAVGNCNRTTGECLKCIYNTGGSRCESCLPGFFGEALKEPKGDCRACDCNTFGTIPSEGNRLICEQPTGICPCKAHVDGMKCDKCEEGFFDLASGVGCQECMCDVIGSVNTSCNIGNGQCHCREGVVGPRCNECAPSHYGFSLDGCKPCECDDIGSLSLQCDPNGQCPCRENVEGRRCDRCKENKHNRQAGCVDCPPCYNLVQDAVSLQRSKLNEMTSMLEKIKTTLTVSDDQDFEAKLATVQKRVDDLWNSAREATGGDEAGFLEKVNDLRERVRQIDQTSKQINDTLGQCSINAASSMGNLTLTQDAVERAQEALKNAQRFLDTEGNDALARAEEKAREFGQQSQQMSEYARQARLLAEDHEKAATEIEKIGTLALNTSKSAHELLWNSINQERTLAEEARQLFQATRQLEEEMKATKAKGTEALDKSKQSHNDALNLYKDAHSLSVPVVDLVAIKEQAGVAKDGAEQLKQSLDELTTGKAELMREIEGEVEKTRRTLDSAITYQQAADELMADLHTANASAEEARKQAENVFAEATKIYDTLRDFNQNVDDSKEKAKAASEKTPEIQRLIYDATTQTRANQQALFGSKFAATTARTEADEAKKIAEKASKEAGEIRAECNATKTIAENLRDEVDTLSNRVAGISAELVQAEAVVSEDDVQVKLALEKASEAQTNAKKAYAKVQNALNAVQEIQLTLDNLDNINDEGLEGLERKIARVEAEFNRAGLDDKVKALQESRNKQLLWIKNYEDELDFLKREVENVQEIRNSLPPNDKCWKRMRLEPT